MTENYKKNSRYISNGKLHNQSPKQLLIPVGETVVISVHHPSNYRLAYMCEAKVIRQPIYRGGPYKLMISGVRLNDPKNQDSVVQKLLGLKLLRRQENVNSLKTNHWTRQDTDIWVRLDGSTIDSLVKKAIVNIRREANRHKFTR